MDTWLHEVGRRLFPDGRFMQTFGDINQRQYYVNGDPELFVSVYFETYQHGPMLVHHIVWNPPHDDEEGPCMAYLVRPLSGGRLWAVPFSDGSVAESDGFEFCMDAVYDLRVFVWDGAK